MKRSNFFLKAYLPNLNIAASKAREDLYEILLNEGFDEIPFKIIESFSFKKIYNRLQFFLSILLIPSCSILVIENPFITAFLNKKVFRWIKYRKIVVVAFIHDLDYIKYGKERRNEKLLLSCCDIIICHTKKMENKLREKYKDKQFIILNIFDYLMTRNIDLSCFPTHNVEEKISVLYAGNLEEKKAGFIYDVKNLVNDNKNMIIHLCGPNFNPKENIHPCYKYIGILNSEHPETSYRFLFGLLWNGGIIKSKEDEYLKFIAPHKISFYLALGLPVIDWKYSAMAEFIIENKIGFLISDFNSLEEEIKNWVEPEIYSKLQKNVHRVRKNLLSGYYTRSAFNTLANLQLINE